MYHVAIDIGGTFTDCAVMDDGGRVVCIAKSPSTRLDPSEGVLDVLAVAAEELNVPTRAFLQETRLLIHGCTVATNAMIQRDGATTGLITSRGHEDAVLIGKVLQKVAGLSEREVLHQARLSKASPPLVEPRHIVGVRERVDAHGDVVAPLVLSDVEAAAERLVSSGVSSLAICFLWSFLNNAHEQAARDLIRARYPELYVQTSSEVAPVLGEYERAITTALSAYLGPPILGYLEHLAARLKEHGYQRELLLSHCMGGLTTMDEVRRRPLLTLDSGPAGGVLGARYFGAVYGEPNVLCTDMGGTSFDVSLIEQGEFSLDEEPVIDKYTFLVPKIAVSSIGAGGGSIIWVDADGILRVGPHSAGSQPGPACYGQGGELPTVADADVVLGYLNPSNFLGGRQRLDAGRAHAALAQVAQQAGMDTVAAAAGAFHIVNAQMADLIRRTTVEKGHDPREFALFAYGGAAPTHAAYYARELRMKRIYIPRYSSVFSALGMLTGGIVHSAEASHSTQLPLEADSLSQVGAAYEQLERRVLDQFHREGYQGDIKLRRFAYVKYRLQPRAMAVELSEGALATDLSDELQTRFESRYAELYGEAAGYRRAGIELAKVRVDGRAATVTPDIVAHQVTPQADVSTVQRGERSVYFLESGSYIPTPIYDGEALRSGHRLPGPSIVERMGDTIVIPPAVTGEIDRFENLVLQVQDKRVSAG